MLRALDAKPTRAWLKGLPSRLARSSGREALAAGDARALAVVPDLFRTRYRKLRKCARRLTRESSMADYHKLRVRTKQLRYALEIIAPTYARPAEELLAALLKLQGRLGSQHDADVIAAYLTQLAADPPPQLSPRTLFLMGRLSELHARKAGRMDGEIGKAWRKVRGKRWKSLRAQMKELRDDLPETSRGDESLEGSLEGDGMSAGAAGGSAAGAGGP